jgi:hypothetical protein
VPVETYVYDSTTNSSGGKRGITFMPFSEGPRNCVGQVRGRLGCCSGVYTLCNECGSPSWSRHGGWEWLSRYAWHCPGWHDDRMRCWQPVSRCSAVEDVPDEL